MGIDYGREIGVDRKKPAAAKGFHFFSGEDVPSADNLRKLLPYILDMFENEEFSRAEYTAQVLRDQLYPAKEGKTSANRLRQIVKWLEDPNRVVKNEKVAANWLDQMLGWTYNGFVAMYKDNFY